MHLDIISQYNDFRGRTLQQYNVERINTIGVYGDEPFSIRFRNSSINKVQVKLSLDGTDIISGQVANHNPQSKMWVVNGYGSMELKAWPESHQGGAAFVFSSVENSVAAHTHGDLTAKGFINCAVFVEGYIPPQRFYGVAVAGCGDYEAPKTFSLNRSVERSAEASMGPAIGAGSYQEQKISSAEGLREPILSQIIQVRYLWWDDLVAKLRSGVGLHTAEYPTGFHGIDLGSTPRIGGPQISSAGNYSRFS